jgi:hypothetical protein
MGLRESLSLPISKQFPHGKTTDGFSSTGKEALGL